jgi:hypothetical protein
MRHPGSVVLFRIVRTRKTLQAATNLSRAPMKINTRDQRFGDVAGVAGRAGLTSSPQTAAKTSRSGQYGLGWHVTADAELGGVRDLFLRSAFGTAAAVLGKPVG